VIVRGLIFIIFFITSSIIFAQAIDLEQARALALANSRSLARYEMSIRNSILNERNQLYSMLPQVSAGYRASMNFMNDWEFINPIDTLNANATISITQVIFQGGKSFMEKAIRAIETENIRKDALAEYFNVLDAIDNAYYAVLESLSAVEAEEASLQSSILNLSIAEIRAANGMINQGDYLRALADKESRENSRNQAQRNLNLNLTRFMNLTGIKGNIILEPINFDAYEDVLAYLSRISYEEADELYDEFWNIMAVSNPSIARASNNSRRAELNFTSIARDYAPVISASVTSSVLNYSTANGFESPTGRGSVTITGSIPIDVWVLANRVERSRIARDSAALDYINTEISLELELLNALSNIFTQAASVLSSRRSLEYTQRHYEFVTERYRLSLSSVSDVNEVTSLLISSQNSLNRASYSFLQSLSRLRSLCAMDDEERLLGLLLGRS